MSQAGREIELKFHCAPGDLAAVLAAAPAGQDEVRELISVYFDTPDRALERAGVSLRVRESGGRRIQTLKRGKGLSREEHEQPVEGFAPDANSGPLREVLAPDAAAALSPAFYVGVHRCQRLVRRGEAEIEIALDQGEVRAGDGKSPISEVELELKAGPPAALFDLARELLKAAPLYLSFDGKASVGQALTARGKAGARRKDSIVLKPDATVADAFQATARSALAQIAGNAQALRDAADAESVHQLRVAARRLRNALSTFAPIVRDARRDWVKDELRWLAHACDRARDLDVFLAAAKAARRTLTPSPEGFVVLVAAAEAARAQAADAVRELASSQRFRLLLLELTAWIETGPWLEDPARTALRAGSARSFAAERLERQLKVVRRAGRGLAKAAPAARHELRLEAKKLRYGAEAFGSLYPAKAIRPLIGPLKDLQTELGALNDAEVAQRLTASLACEPVTAFAAGQLAGLRAAEAPFRIARAARALKQLAETEPFWR